MAKKYELTSETTLLRNGITVLYRIKAVRDFDDVKAGDLGGWVESEDNLAHDDNCWIYKDAMVYGDAYVDKNAKIKDHARVYDDAWVTENAEIYGEAIIGGCACIRDFASVFGNTFIHGCAIVCEYAKVFGCARVGAQAYISGHSKYLEMPMYMEIPGSVHLHECTILQELGIVLKYVEVQLYVGIRSWTVSLSYVLTQLFKILLICFLSVRLKMIAILRMVQHISLSPNLNIEELMCISKELQNQWNALKSVQRMSIWKRNTPYLFLLLLQKVVCHNLKNAIVIKRKRGRGSTFLFPFFFFLFD